MGTKPIGAYQIDGNTGWAAYNADGCTWPVNVETAQELEDARNNRNANAGKPASPAEIRS